MPGFLLTQASSVSCTHQGRATPAATVAVVRAGGSPVVAQPTPYTIAACPFPTQSGGPCATGTWTTGATMVRSHGRPLAIMGAASTCAPTGTPMVVASTQVKVRAR